MAKAFIGKLAGYRVESMLSLVWSVVVAALLVVAVGLSGKHNDAISMAQHAWQ